MGRRVAVTVERAGPYALVGRIAGRGDATPDRSPPLIVLAGATATGKTRLALELASSRALGPARRSSSADSRQVYRGMDIGTAKVDSRRPRARTRITGWTSWTRMSRSRSRTSSATPSTALTGIAAARRCRHPGRRHRPLPARRGPWLADLGHRPRPGRPRRARGTADRRTGSRAWSGSCACVAPDLSGANRPRQPSPRRACAGAGPARRATTPPPRPDRIPRPRRLAGAATSSERARPGRSSTRARAAVRCRARCDEAAGLRARYGDQPARLLRDGLPRGVRPVGRPM